MKAKSKVAKNVWWFFFLVGYLTIFTVALFKLKDIPFQHQATQALGASLLWFICAFLGNKLPRKFGSNDKPYLLMLWMGIIEIVLAVFFWLILEPRTTIAIYAQMTNLIFSVMSLVGIYSTLIAYLFPGLRNTSTTTLNTDDRSQITDH